MAAMSQPTRTLRFTKMHGAGNDYVYLDGFTQELPRDDTLAALARRLAHRQTGVGGDGLILVLPPTAGGHARMRMFNLDGSEGQMCGNGIRCVAKLVADRGYADANPLRIETASGVREVHLVRDDGRVTGASVDMGEPSLGLDAVGAKQGIGGRTPYFQRVDGPTFRLSRHAGGGPWEATLVSMGNPHAVVFVDDLGDLDLPVAGPSLAEHPAFPDGINTHFVQVIDRGRVIVKHWERGSGPTLACGTGACAVCVAGAVRGLTDRRVVAEVPGGELTLDWEESTDRVRMTGPAVEVFQGELPL